MHQIMGTPVFFVNRFSVVLLFENTGMSIGTRIKLLRKEAKWSQIELADKVGLKQSTISDLEVGKSTGTTYLAQIAQVLGVNALWLETGKGARDDGPDVVPRDQLPGAVGVHAATLDDDGHVQVPMVTLRLQAGVTGFQTEADRRDGGTFGVRKRVITQKKLNPDKLVAIPVQGESMEPALYAGDIVVIDTSDKRPVDGIVFAVNYEGEAIVKRLSRDAGDWWLTSDNIDQRKYHRKICRGDACIIVGRVVLRETLRI